MTLEVQDPEIVINRAVVNALVRRHLRRWILVGIVFFFVVLFALLLALPQSFSSIVSLSVQQPVQTSQALSLLTGQSGSRKYIGVISSRRIATLVERKVHLQSFYGLESQKKAVDMLVDSVRPDDNATQGLLYIRLSLPGPPRLAFGAGDRRDRVKQKVTEAANTYAAALRDYAITQDNDRDTVLLREADTQSRKARADLDDTINRMREFLRNLRHLDPRAMPASEADTKTAGELLTLYQGLAQVEADIRALEAAHAAENRLVAGQLRNLSSLPAEDELLTDARNQVNQARQRLESLQIQLGPDSPRVVAAREQLRLAEKELQRQIEGIRQKRTTEEVIAESTLARLRARRAAIMAQINEAESRLPLRRELSVEFQRLQYEIQVRLEARKATESEAAKLRLNAVSAQNLMTVVDYAIPPDSGSPGILMQAVISLALVLAGMGVWIVVAYRREARRSVLG